MTTFPTNAAGLASVAPHGIDHARPLRIDVPAHPTEPPTVDGHPPGGPSGYAPQVLSVADQRISAPDPARIPDPSVPDPTHPPAPSAPDPARPAAASAPTAATSFTVPDSYGVPRHSVSLVDTSDPHILAGPQGQRFIVRGERAYPVRDDRGNGTWRAYDAHNPSRPSYPVRLNEQGKWQSHNESD
jgi:hypothetical protein